MPRLTQPDGNDQGEPHWTAGTSPPDCVAPNLQCSFPSDKEWGEQQGMHPRSHAPMYPYTHILCTQPQQMLADGSRVSR